MGEKPMSNLWPLVILAAYFVLIRWVLPRFGVMT